MSEKPPFSDYVGADVVVDTKIPTVAYLGRLEESANGLLRLSQVDVHDMQETRTTREVYVMESKKYGVKVNRKEVLVRLEEVVSVSRLDDIMIY